MTSSWKRRLRRSSTSASNLSCRARATLSGTLSLAEGNHALRVRAVGAPGRLAFYWRTPEVGPEIVPATVLYVAPVTANGLLGRYFGNGDWQAPERFARDRQPVRRLLPCDAPAATLHRGMDWQDCHSGGRPVRLWAGVHRRIDALDRRTTDRAGEGAERVHGIQPRPERKVCTTFASGLPIALTTPTSTSTGCRRTAPARFCRQRYCFPPRAAMPG